MPAFFGDFFLGDISEVSGSIHITYFFSASGYTSLTLYSGRYAPSFGLSLEKPEVSISVITPSRFMSAMNPFVFIS